MPDPQMSVDDFAGKIKAKYPDYANISNDSLVAAVVAKHPEYRDQVNFAPNAGLASPGAPPKVQMQEQEPSAVGAFLNDHPVAGGAVNALSAFASRAKDLAIPLATGPGALLTGAGQGSSISEADQEKLRSGQYHKNIFTGAVEPSVDASNIGQGLINETNPINPVDVPSIQKGEYGKAAGNTAANALALWFGRKAAGAEPLPEGANEGRTLGSSAMDSIIRPSVRDYNFGKNPGGQIPAEGIVAATQEGLLKKIGDKKLDIGKQADAQLQDAKASGKQINVEPLIDGPIDNAVKKAAASNDQGLVDKLEGIRNSLKQDLVVGADGKITSNGAKNLTLDPIAANQLKRQIGEDTKWNGVDPHAEELNSTRVQIYRQLDKAIDGTSPGVDQLNDRYANLLTAEKALSRANDMRQKHDFISLKDTLAATGGAGIAAASGHMGAGAIAGAITLGLMRRGMESTAAKTVAAKLMRSNAPGSVPASLVGTGAAALGKQDGN